MKHGQTGLSSKVMALFLPSLNEENLSMSYSMRASVKLTIFEPENSLQFLNLFKFKWISFGILLSVSSENGKHLFS